MSLEDTWKEFTDLLGQNHVPEIFLVVMGLLILALCFSYLKNEEGGCYKGIYVVSLVLAAATVVLLVTKALPMQLEPMLILCLACFTIIIRPFRETSFSALLALLVLAFVYITLNGIDNVELLQQFWVKLVIALVAAVLVYIICSFVEGVVKLFGKLFNWWPFLVVIGVLCILEAALIATGNGSIIGLFTK